MATISIEVVAGAQTFTHTRTVSAAHLTRLVSAYRALLNMPSATDEEVVQAWAQGIFSGTVANVKRSEKDVAAASASDAISDIILT